jgi:hypothetical protein
MTSLKNWSHGMNSTKCPTKRFLKPDEICGLIKACGEFETVAPGWRPFIANSADTAISEAQLTDDKAKALERDEAALREDQLAIMAIENPLQFEQLIAQGEVVDG